MCQASERTASDQETAVNLAQRGTERVIWLILMAPWRWKENQPADATTRLLRRSSRNFSLIEAFAGGNSDRLIEALFGREFSKEPRSQLFDLILIGGNVDQVVSLFRIRFQIMKAVAIPMAVIINVLEAVGPNGKQSRRGGKIPLPMVLVQNMIPPRCWLAGQQRREGPPVEFGFAKWLNAGDSQEGRRDVDVLDHFRNLIARRNHPGCPRDHRDSDAGFKCITLVIEAMFSQVKTVVTHVNDHRVFGEAVVSQIVHHAADVFVEAVDGLAITVKQVIKVGYRIVIERAGFHVVDAMNRIPTVANPA